MKFNKKLLYACFPLLLVVFSCSKKDNPVETPATDQKLYNVNFSVSTFSSEVTPLSSKKSSVISQTAATASATLSDQITELRYLFYNTSGQLLKDTVQISSAANFGNMSVQLPAGSYKLAVLGIDGSYDLVNTEDITSAFMGISYKGTIGDWFRNVSDFIVSDQNSNKTVVLDRVVGKIGIVITDAIPTDVGKITLTFETYSWIRLTDSNLIGKSTRTVEFPIQTNQIGTSNFSSSAYVIPLYNEPIKSDVSIRAYNTAGTLIAEKIITNVVVEKNKMTTLTGALFTSVLSNTATKVTLNSDWKPATNISF